MSSPRSPDNHPSGWWQQNVLRKFDLIIHYPDGTDYDENGCSGCLPCLPWCRRPVFKAGETITGYLLLRPSRKTRIHGVSVKFRGTYETGWKEENIQWGSFGSFFTEDVTIVENRLINLEYKWYRFDFEYKLPANLPSSFKEQEGRVVYFAYGRVTRPDGPEIETFNSHFEVQGQADIDLLPGSLHESAERRKVKTFTPDQSEAPNGSENEALQTGEDDNVIVVCTINKQAFLMGQSIITDVTIENHARGCIQCVLNFEQVFSYQASLGRERRGEPDQTLLYHHHRRSHITTKELVPPWMVKVPAGATETFSRMFDIPDQILPTTSFSGIRLPSSWSNHILDTAIKVKYLIKVVLHPQWSSEELCLPVEVVIGNKDSGSRQPLGLTEEYWERHEAAENLDTPSHKELDDVDTPHCNGTGKLHGEDDWDTPPSGEEDWDTPPADDSNWDTPPCNGAPPCYEDYFFEEV